MNRRLSRRLPAGARVRVVLVDELPRTADGGIDVRALDPDDEVETRIAALWAAVLGVAEVGRDVNLFRLGVHSLLVLQALSRVRKEFRVSVSLRTFFEGPTVAALAAAVRQLSPPTVRLDEELTALLHDQGESAVLRSGPDAAPTWVTYVVRG